MSKRVVAEADCTDREQGYVSGDKGKVMENKVLHDGQGLTFPKKQQLLNATNLWMADSGASVHTNPYFPRSDKFESSMQQ